MVFGQKIQNFGDDSRPLKTFSFLKKLATIGISIVEIMGIALFTCKFQTSCQYEEHCAYVCKFSRAH